MNLDPWFHMDPGIQRPCSLRDITAQFSVFDLIHEILAGGKCGEILPDQTQENDAAAT